MCLVGYVNNQNFIGSGLFLPRMQECIAPIINELTRRKLNKLPRFGGILAISTTNQRSRSYDIPQEQNPITYQIIRREKSLEFPFETTHSQYSSHIPTMSSS